MSLPVRPDSCTTILLATALLAAAALAGEPRHPKESKRDSVQDPIPLAPGVLEVQVLAAFDQDHFRFEGRQGTRLLACVDAAVAGEPQAILEGSLDVLDPAGSLLATTPLGPSRTTLAFDPPQDGDYLLRVRGQGSAPGAYAVGVTPVASEDEPNDDARSATPLPAGASVAGSVGETEVADCFRSTWAAGVHYLAAETTGARPLTVTVQDGAGVTILSVPIGGQGVLLALGSDEVVTVEIRAAARTQLRARSPYTVFHAEYLSTTPPFFAIPEREANGTRPSANPIIPGVPVEGAVSPPSDRDLFRFDANAGDAFHVDVTARITPVGSDLDSVLEILDQNGVLLANDDEPAGGFDAFLTFVAPSTGTYFIRVQGTGAPSLNQPYLLTLMPGAVASRTWTGQQMEVEPNDLMASATALALDSSVLGTISAPGDADFYTFTLSLNETITLDVDARDVGSSLDSVLELFDQGGASVALDDDGDDCALFDSILLDQALAPGTYFVRVTHFTTFSGGSDFFYALHLTRSGPSGAVESEPNDTIATADPISIGQSASGAIDPAGDEDFFLFMVPGLDEKPIRIDVDAGGLAASPSTLDAAIELLQTDGTLIDQSDGPCLLGDPVLSRSLQPGSYAVRIRAAGGGGGSGASYGLSIHEWFDESLVLPAPVESEPNDSMPAAGSISLGDAVSGVIGAPGDVDFHAFDAKAGDVILVDVVARPAGSPLDSVVEVFAPGGASLVENDDEGFGSLDSFLIFTAPSDGTYTVSIRDFAAVAGSADHFYILQVRESAHVVRFEPNVASPGGNVTLTLRGHPADLFCLFFSPNLGTRTIPGVGTIDLLSPLVFLLGTRLPPSGELEVPVTIPAGVPAGTYYFQSVTFPGLTELLDETSEPEALVVQ